MPRTAGIEAIDLGRRFQLGRGLWRGGGRVVEAVRGVSFSVAPGETFGLLGPNGAGKTTTIKMLVTLLLPTAGTARVGGLDVTEDPQGVRRRIGYVFGGDRGLYQRLSAYDNLRYFAELYGVAPRRQRARIGELMEMVGLAGRERERVEGYSRGMRQRLHIARGLLHDPGILFLDEPTIGIDPVGARELRATIGRLKREGKTILLTTHYMQEADELCERVAIIRDGVIVGAGTPASLKSGLADQRILEIETTALTAEAVERVRAVPGVISADLLDRPDTQTLRVRTDAGVDTVRPVILALSGVRLGRISTPEATLEDAYVDLVGKE